MVCCAGSPAQHTPRLRLGCLRRCSAACSVLPCEPCIAAKHHRSPIASANHADDAITPMHIVHMALCGPQTHTRPRTARAVGRTGPCAIVHQRFRVLYTVSSWEQRPVMLCALHGSHGSTVHAATTLLGHLPRTPPGPPKDGSDSGPDRCMCTRCAKHEQRRTQRRAWRDGGGAPDSAQRRPCPTLMVPVVPQARRMWPHSTGPTQNLF
jgi:hypothetical protein